MEQENNTINLIGVGTDIKGDIQSTGDIRIDGTLKGNLKTKGKVVIGGTGMVKGEVYCKNSDVEGKIEGKINVQELLSLKSTSVILGDISAKRLAIEPGARFTGNCNMSNEALQANVVQEEPVSKEPKKS
ncbi:MAG: polymer-forming cytoskeletal protein [Bacteroidales bacterium]|nr:polymer-forming cytoskeletal protein [Bacteroidales bacterium]